MDKFEQIAKRARTSYTAEPEKYHEHAGREITMPKIMLISTGLVVGSMAAFLGLMWCLSTYLGGPMFIKPGVRPETPATIPDMWWRLALIAGGMWLYLVVCLGASLAYNRYKGIPFNG